MQNKHAPDIKGIIDSFFDNQNNIWKSETGLTIAECKKAEKKLLTDILQSQADQYEREKREMIRNILDCLNYSNAHPDTGNRNWVSEQSIRYVAQKYGVDLSE